MHYSTKLEQQLEDLFATDIYQRGAQLQRDHRVSALQSSATISASVDDPDEGCCNTFIHIESDGETLVIDGECSCEQETNCAHVVATLMQSLAVVEDTKIDRQHREKKASAKPTLLDGQLDKRLHYVLSPCAMHLKLQMYLVSAEQVSTYILPLSLSHPARFIRPADLLLLELIPQHSQEVNGEAYILSQFSAELIHALIESECCHWQDITSPVLQPGAVKKGRWFWHQYIDGRQKLKVKLEDDYTEALPVCPIRYLDRRTNSSGLIETGLTRQQDQLLFTLPAFQPEQIASVLERAELVPVLATIAAPQIRQFFITRQRAPQPVAHIMLATESTQSCVKKPAMSGTQLSAHISFDYPAGRVQRFDPALFVGEFCTDHFIRWQRDTAQEATLTGIWQQHGWYVYADEGQQAESWQLKVDSNGLAMACFLAFRSAQLVRQGWRINVDEACPQVLVAEDMALKVEVAKSMHQQKFRLKLMLCVPRPESLTTQQQPLNLLGALSLSLQRKWLQAAALADQSGLGQSVLSAHENSLVIIDNQNLKLLLEELIELQGRHLVDGDGYLELSRARLEAVKNLLQTLTIQSHYPLVLIDEALLTRTESDLSELAQLTEERGLNAQLRPYQQKGVEWLHRLHQHGLGGLLADDMGLGKTVQILSFLWQIKCRGQLNKPVLILAPTSLLGNWQAEAETFTPALSLQVLHGPKRAEHFPHLNRFDLIITSYPLLIRDLEVLLEVDWGILILDEAQAIKNDGSRSAKAVREFNVRINICVSGTPLENHLGELWALFDFMLPGLLGNKAQFKDWFKIPIQQQQNSRQQDLLLQRIAPVMLRRNKQTVLPQLPPKVHQLCTIPLSEDQQQIYQDIESQMRERVCESIQQRGVDGSRMHILNALTRLRQVCCDPRLLAETGSTGLLHSAKLSRLLDMLDEMLQQGRRILLFSQFTSMLTLVEKELKKKAVRYALLTGKTSDRQHQVVRFQQGEVDLFLISLKAGGSGLNLTRADTVIHYDPWWNPAIENQATDRAHRIGQYSSVMVYKLIAANTIEQKIVEMQQNKQLIADSLLEGASRQEQQINSIDLKSLLQLLGV